MKHLVPCFRQFSVAAALRAGVTQLPSGIQVERVTLLSSVQYSMSHGPTYLSPSPSSYTGSSWSFILFKIHRCGSSKENSNLLIRYMSGLDLPHHLLQYSISSATGAMYEGVKCLQLYDASGLVSSGSALSVVCPLCLTHLYH
ncbi:hypothetical protein Pmani_020843 [Petrolisthes manimaculis]|uniref:Uncharacterized protein n=1 Tax=Petrolisthes manimaculis TaxID=1843537 RepID=A0AAE1PHV7_9EUCA|nr:hypothetical protein Pmani_020843 [Petrolisthes manimaculis]